MKSAIRKIRKKLRANLRHRMNWPLNRTDFLSEVAPDQDALEIGPYSNPQLNGANVKYFDIMDSEQIAIQSKRKGYLQSQIVDIDFVSATGDLSIVPDRSFDLIFSSHTVEHIPNLVGHFQHIARILRSGGKYLFAVPDHRYCHDHFMPASTIAEVLAAFKEDRVLHTFETHRKVAVLRTHNDPKKHWRGDHGAPAGESAFDAQECRTRMARGDYINAHAWQFTPASLRGILSELILLGLFRLDINYISPTMRQSLEFYCSLQA